MAENDKTKTIKLTRSLYEVRRKKLQKEKVWKQH